MLHSLRVLSAATLVVGLAGCASGLTGTVTSITTAPSLPPLPEVTLSYSKHSLPNGLTLIVHEDRKAPLVAVNVWYHVGSKDERPGRTGFAHLFEHLMYKGTAHYDGDPFKLLEPIGATKMNGTTWFDRTNYFQNVPKGALDLALWLESERMGHLLPALTQAKLDEERGVVLNEKRQGENQPYGQVWEVIADRTWPEGHPYSWTTIGSEDDLNAATLDDVRAWFQQHYGAANATLVIAGDVDTEDVVQRVTHYFGDIPGGPPQSRTEAWVAPRQDESRHVMQDRVPQTRQMQVWNVPGYCEADHTLLQLAASLIGGGKNTRLYDRLVHEEQSATRASAYLMPTEIAAQFVLDLMVRPDGDVDAVETSARAALAHFLEEGPSIEELERARTEIFAGAVRALERIDGYRGKASMLAQASVYCDDPGHVETWLSRIREATPASVRDVARRWLTEGRFVLTVAPFSDGEVAAEGADRSAPPAVAPADPLALPALEHFVLDNGMKVAFAQRSAAPVVQFTMLFDGGVAADHLQAPGTAGLTMELLDEGAGDRDALALAAEASRLGANLGTGANLDLAYVSLNALSSRLDPSLGLMADLLRRPRMETADFERLRARALAAISQELSNPASLANRAYAAPLFGAQHPYAMASVGRGTPASVAAMQLDDLQQYRHHWLRPDNAQLVVVGDTTRAVLEPLLNRHFGDWTPPAAPLAPLDIPQTAPPAGQVILLDRPQAQQSYLLAARLAPPLNAADAAALEVANQALGGSFSARLNTRLRVDKNWSYGAYTGIRNSGHQRAWVATAPVQSDKTVEALTEMVKVLDGPRTDAPLTEAEVQFARDSLTRGLPGDNETTGEIANSLIFPLAYDVAEDYWNRYVPTLQMVDADRANAAERALTPIRDAVFVIVGDLSQIEAPVRAAATALGLGTVRVETIAP
jgi:zinc protease